MKIPHPNDPDLIMLLPPGADRIPSWTVTALQNGRRDIRHCPDTEKVLEEIREAMTSNQEAVITIQPYL